jgi:hypothetical protein
MMTKRKKNQKAASLQVIVTINEGLADVLLKSPGVAVTLYDYDVEGMDEDALGLGRDPDGQLCAIGQWNPAEEIAVPQSWPATKQVRQASYCRTWKCPDCGRRVEHSYEAMAEVGSPICPRCDTEMELQ